MASNGLTLAHSKRLSLGQHNGPNASLIMDKQKATLRRSTPDSEALASSEDELDVQQRASYATSGPTVKSVRRPSWINEAHHNLNRKASMGSSEPRSPGSIQNIVTTAADASSWSVAASSLGRNASVNSSLPWSSTIWNNESQKGLPSRFAEVLPSPTNLDSLSSFSDEVMQSPTRRESSSDASFPFAIPLQPTLKSYRSQSYSVGQLDQEPANINQARAAQGTYTGRARTSSSYSGLQHRPSRPSMLGEFSADTALGQLREVDDDEESTTSSGPSTRFSSTQARQIEQLAMENAILRQHAQMNQSLNVNASSASYSAAGNAAMRPTDRGLQISESVLEEPDDEHANDEDLALTQTLSRRGFGARRQSEYAAGPGSPFATTSSTDQKYFMGGKKGHWQSSLGFGGSIDPPQSRRHSFADVPVRLPSSSGMKMSALRASETTNAPSQEEAFPHGIASQYPSFLPTNQILNAGPYQTAHVDVSSQPGFASYQQQRRPGHYGQPQPHHGQSLYLVTFKAARAEFYYVQEGMGLDVNPGDLVIVEADRGTDLGTVAHKNVDWTTARELKERYVAEHYNWLMMFSRQGQNGQSSSVNGWSATQPDRSQPPQVTGATAQMTTTSIDGPSAEIKPKMIKRLAQNHEIHTLREKEGNEAKAKRMCQQKVAEHHLNMEILDAEFQMDWKKLTFYYFADSYINFNSLVTDLFKIYKTRIWMSAINPASFVSTTLGQPTALALGHSINVDASRYPENRHRPENYAQSSSPPEVPYVQTWYSQPENNLPTSSLSPYAQYWAGSNIQQAMPVSQDYLRGNGSSFRQSPISNTTHYTIGSGPQPRSSPNYTSEDTATSSYADQLQSLQGLSLGPDRQGV